MRVSQDEKAISHARIVESAARRVREHGIEATSVNDVMRDASMTHGGFYRHFASKDALLEAALAKSFDELLSVMDESLGQHHGTEMLAEFQNFYLSDQHAAMLGTCCPVPGTAADVSRRSPKLRTKFGAGMDRVINRLAEAHEGTGTERRAQAIRLFAMLAGAILIARASDPATAQTILAACRRADVAE